MRALLAGLVFLIASPAALAKCIAADGDSLVCDRKKIRLVNVYAAELKEPGGQAAKKKLAALIKDKDVVIVPRAGRGSGVRYHVRKAN